MIELSNGHQFEFMAASGSLAYDGNGWPYEYPLRWTGLIDPRLFTIVIKTLTRKPRVGNLKMHKPLGCIRFLRGGTVNAVGLTNPGLDAWCRKYGPSIEKSPYNLVGSIVSDNKEDLAEMAYRLNQYNLKALELNMSCPNSTDHSHLMNNVVEVVEMVRAVKKVSKFPLILKLSAVHDYKTIAKETEGFVEAISINSIPWREVYPERVSPLKHLGGGGVSGQPAQVLNWKMLAELTAHTTTPVIGPSIWKYENMAKLEKLGAKAIGFGSIFLRYPWRPTLYVRRYLKERQSKK